METIICGERKFQSILNDRTSENIWERILSSMEKMISTNPCATITNRGTNEFYKEITVKFVAGWGTGADLTVLMKEVRVQNENTSKFVNCLKIDVNLNWTSTSRDLETAGIALRLYDGALKVGQMIKGMYSDLYILAPE